jgi:hypothetical protein
VYSRTWKPKGGMTSWGVMEKTVLSSGVENWREPAVCVGKHRRKSLRSAMLWQQSL